MDNCNCNYNYHNTNADILGEALIAYGIYTTYQKWKMRRRIKKYLKIVVEFSNIIQDEKKKKKHITRYEKKQTFLNKI